MSLVYMITDSLLLDLKGIDIFDKIEEPLLKNIKDKSNFSPLHPQYILHNERKLEYLKSET